MIKLVLVFSLALNALLGVLYFQKKSETKQVVKISNSANSPSRNASTVVTLPGKTNTVGWETVESADYKEYIANLRKIGCPEETIRDIIIADVDKLFESKRKALTKKEPQVEFWKTGMQMFTAHMDEESVRERQALSRERSTLLKTLLGIDVPEKEMAAALNPLGRILDFLPEAKQTALIQAMERFQAKAMKEIGNGTPDAQDMMKVQKELDAELTKILTPQEKEDYDLRLSQTSMMMRMQLAVLEPSEQEFRDIFKLQKKFDEEFSPFGNTDGEEGRKKRQAAQEELDAEIKKVLGDRYVDYERSKSPTYSGLHKLSQRHGVSKDQITQAYAAKKAMEDELRAARARQLPADQMKQISDQLAIETQNHVRQTLGQEAYEAYIKQSGSDWAKGPKQTPARPVPVQ